MMRTLPALLSGCLLCAAALAQTPATSTPEARLIDDIGRHAELMSNLEQLCDGIGARLTGSPQLQAAQQWAMARLRAYGAVGVHLEAYDMGRPWRRGPARARLLNASGMALDVVQKGWTEGTVRPVRAEVALLDVKTLDEFKAAAPALKGKIVLVESVPRATSEQRKDPARWFAGASRAVRDAQLAGVLLVSSKDHGLRDMWGGPRSLFDRHAAIVTREHANLLKRLLARGIVPQVELELQGGFDARPAVAHNVVADYPGSGGAGSAGEMVVLGAHLDSWDLGSGATDNGSGVVAMLEVLRAWHALGLRPQRALRIVLFSGEEQGLLGSRAYVAAHRNELDRIQAVLVQDTGSGRVIGFPDMRNEAWYAALTRAVAPAAAIGPLDVMYGPAGGSDFEPFLTAGVPAFPALQDERDYRSHSQHSQVDSLDHADRAGLVQAAQVLAVVAWGLANGEKLPHASAAN
jgi:carboxypeptidase Q